MTPWLDDGDVQLYHGDVTETLRALPAGIAQTCVTSPPYWGLRDYSAEGQIGLEATPDLYVERMVRVFREVWRVLRADGTVWLNLGDSYAQGGSRQSASEAANGEQRRVERQKIRDDDAAVYAVPTGWGLRGDRAAQTAIFGLKPKDLVGVPWRVAFALQADGWYLRSDIVWSKPNPMPESVTDRPTKAHEYLFLLSKQPRYYYDADAIREPSDDKQGRIIPDGHEATWIQGMNGGAATGRIIEDGGKFYGAPAAGRNRRSVWTIPTQPFPEAHFATYPEALVRPCILAGTSEHGECIECGAPWVRVIDYERTQPGATGGNTVYEPGRPDGFYMPGGGFGNGKRDTIGWRASCCDVRRLDVGADTAPGDADSEPSTPRRGPGSFPYPTRPQLVLDPFIGSGTTAHVARKHGRRCIGIDLSAEYLTIAAQRLQQLSLLA